MVFYLQTDFCLSCKDRRVVFVSLNFKLLNSITKMKKTLLSIFAFGFAASSIAQTYTPSASALPSGTLNQAYPGQVINFTVPATAPISGSAISGALTAAFPAAAPFVGLLGGLTLDLTISTTTLTVEGLPSGVTATCSATPCTFAAGASGSFTLGGTPTEEGPFTIDITSLTSGDADLSALIAQLPINPGLPGTLALPQPIPGALDETGYSLFVNNPNGIAERNSVFSLGMYPNPTDGLSTLDVNSTVAGMATVEIYSITGAMVQTSTRSIRVGANRLNVDLTKVPAGIYMVKVSINGHQSLVKTQKK